MRLPITQLKEGENPFRCSSVNDEWVRDILRNVGQQGYLVQGPLQLDLCLTKLEPDYYLRGKMEFKVDQTCARCAETFPLVVEHPFNVALAHVTSPGARSPELNSEESDELDVNFFEGNDIDLSPIVQEQFFLSIPYQSLCRPDCKGLCQQCGRNRNEGECKCSSTNPASPLGALKGLKVS